MNLDGNGLLDVVALGGGTETDYRLLGVIVATDSDVISGRFGSKPQDEKQRNRLSLLDGKRNAVRPLRVVACETGLDASGYELAESPAEIHVDREVPS